MRLFFFLPISLTVCLYLPAFVRKPEAPWNLQISPLVQIELNFPSLPPLFPGASLIRFLGSEQLAAFPQS